MPQENSNSQPWDIWSAECYGQTVAPFVAALTDTIQEWLNPQPTDEILDIGCGEGALTAKLATNVKRIVGVDASANMITAFQHTYPHVLSRVVDCRFLGREKDLTSAGFDKVFSNAAMHWILRDAATRTDIMRACFAALKPGGVIVSESGGLGNVAEVHAALIGELIHRGVTPERAREVSPWWFPSLEMMKALVEEAGFKWIRGEVELRQTKLTEVEGGGIKGWVQLFGANFLEELKSDSEREEAVKNVVEALEGVGRRQHDGGFSINYIRLRFEAQKPV
ncbi:hypothetical protein Egran_06667 [Elaphomyces granulatus]|uniref:Methyltransferase type 11 domain-containing protein n=1 Tax=Elaphomyces granulatus TaxID=519963 RepID=A0A232LN40_9EURO|nr:hypothetical protein Egran_06667 [Elaphomyces granulatus]